jgi:phage terminase small subunit
MGQIKANIKPEYSIKENEKYAWVWRCVRLTNIPGQPRQDVKAWSYVAFTKQDHLRFKDNFRAANVHEAVLIHDGERQRAIDKETAELAEKEKTELVERAKEEARLKIEKEEAEAREKEEAKKKIVSQAKAKAKRKPKKPAK